MRTKPLPATSKATAKAKAPRRLHLPLVLSALIGVAFALYRFGLHVLNPENISWFHGDSVTHFLAWRFFRREPWGVPPGEISGLLAPLGTSIGNADALPLFAFPFKLFSAALPPDFQYLGLWFFISYALQGIFGYLLMRTFCRSRWLALLAGLFFLVSPIMIFRAGHPALSGHWILLFALWHYFRTAQEPNFRFRRYAGLWLLIVAIVGLIHPYLAAMVFPIAFASLLRERLRKRLKLISALGLLLGMGGVLALEWWSSGLLGVGQALGKWGFDYFSMNLNALFNPLTHSRLLPTLPAGGGQYEGLAYLGFGMIVLCVIALVLLFRTSMFAAPQRVFKRLRTSGHLPLAFIALCFALYALGKFVTFGDTKLFEFGFFANFRTLVGTFRAAGRFFWPTYYLIYLVVLVYLVRRLPRSVAALVLGAGLLLQVGDLKINLPFRDGQQTFTRNLEDDRWAQLIGPFKTIALIPAFERKTANRDDYIAFAYLAASQGKQVTTGIVGRLPVELSNARDRLRVEALSGPRSLNRLYVFSAVAFAQRYAPEITPGLRCYNLNAYVACYNDKVEKVGGIGPEIDVPSYVPQGYKRVELADYLETYRDQVVVVVAKKGIGDLSNRVSRLLFGSDTPPVPRDGSYAAVIHQGYVSFENWDENKTVQEMWQEGDVLGTGTEAFRVPKTLKVYSVGTPTARAANVFLDGKMLLEPERGLNIVVLNKNFKVISKAAFDTFITDEAVVEK